MMVLMRADAEFQMAEKDCHPSIVEFIQALRFMSPECYVFLGVDALSAWCTSSRGDVFRIVDSWRTFAEQDVLYDGGKGRNTRAGGGDSFHNWGLAIDMIPTRTGYDTATYKGKEWEMGAFFKECGLVQLARNYGLRWGGDQDSWNAPGISDFYDPGHFECGSLPDKALRVQKFAVPGWWNNPNMYTLTSKKTKPMGLWRV
jgi:hypothetical protein